MKVIFIGPLLLATTTAAAADAVVTPSQPTDAERINIKITTIRVGWLHWLRVPAEIYKATELFIFMFCSFRGRVRHRVVVGCKLKF